MTIKVFISLALNSDFGLNKSKTFFLLTIVVPLVDFDSGQAIFGRELLLLLFAPVWIFLVFSL